MLDLEYECQIQSLDLAKSKVGLYKHAKSKCFGAKVCYSQFSWKFTNRVKSHSLPLLSTVDNMKNVL